MRYSTIDSVSMQIVIRINIQINPQVERIQNTKIIKYLSFI